MERSNHRNGGRWLSSQWSEGSIITTDGKRRDLVAGDGSQKSTAVTVRTSHRARRRTLDDRDALSLAARLMNSATQKSS
jgi:hypothetical protein